MNSFDLLHDRISQAVAPLGMTVFGWFVLEEDCQRAGVLIGNGGGVMWNAFEASSEHGDGRPDPMNRWTVRQLGVVAKTVSAGETRFPFRLHGSSAPFWPFQHYAVLATGNMPSPLGLLIDPHYGLWWALRGVLLFDDEKLIQEVQVSNQLRIGRVHPCDLCFEKPCLSACPVNAFASSETERDGMVRLNADACRSHLDSSNSPDCMTLGCRARAACPVGKDHEYPAEQLAFHMKAFKS